MNGLRHIGALCLFGLSVALVVGGILFFASGADGAGPPAPPGNPWLLVQRVVGDPGFGGMIVVAGMMSVAALFVYP